MPNPTVTFHHPVELTDREVDNVFTYKLSKITGPYFLRDGELRENHEHYHGSDWDEPADAKSATDPVLLAACQLEQALRQRKEKERIASLLRQS